MKEKNKNLSPSCLDVWKEMNGTENNIVWELNGNYTVRI